MEKGSLQDKIAFIQNKYNKIPESLRNGNIQVKKKKKERNNCLYNPWAKYQSKKKQTNKQIARIEKIINHEKTKEWNRKKKKKFSKK